MKEDNAGFVIEHRAILKNEWYTEPLTMHLMRHCRLRANFENTKWRGIQLERGQFVTSLKTLSTETGLSVMQVRTALEKLEKSGYITSKPTNKNRLITVLFYSDEQNVNKQANKRVSKQVTSKSANKQQTSNKQANKQITTDNNINNITNKTSVCAPSAHTHKEEAASAPHALGERAAAVTYGEIRQFQIDHHIGGGEMVSEFYNGFEKSGTKIPDNWQDLYIRYARAEWEAQNEFIEKLENGEYIEKWGHADAGT